MQRILKESGQNYCLDENTLTVPMMSLSQGSHKQRMQEIVGGFSEALVTDFKETKVIVSGGMGFFRDKGFELAICQVGITNHEFYKQITVVNFAC